MRYVLHPELELNINTSRRSYIMYFENEYSKLSSYEPVDMRILIEVNIGRSLPSEMRGDRIKIAKFKKILNQNYIVRGLGTDHVIVYMKDSWAGKLYAKNLTLFLQTHVIEPIIYLKLLSRNILLMHAAGVSDGDNGYLFPAYGGTGKTTLTLGLMAEGMQVLGDDLLLVEADTGIVRPYLRPLHLFAYNIRTLRDAIIPVSLRVKIKIKDILRFILEGLTRQEFLIATRVHPEKIYPNFKAASDVPVRKIVFLKKKGHDEEVVVSRKSIDNLANIVLNSEDLNKSLYENILDKNEMESVKKDELCVIKKIIKRIDHFEFVNTRLLEFNNLSGFRDRLLK